RAHCDAADRTRSAAGLDGAAQTARRLNRNSGQICPRPRPHRGRASFANGQNFREVGLHQCRSERKGEGVPVRSLRVPSHVPSHPQTAAKVRGFSLTASEFTAETDWLLEEDGFEPVWGFSCQVVIFGFLPVLCSELESRSSSRRLRS